MNFSCDTKTYFLLESLNMSEITDKECMALSVVELKVELSKKGLTTKGKKDELIARLLAYNKGLDKTNESNEDERDSLVSDSVQKSNETDDGNVTVEPQPTNVPQSNTTDHGADFCSDFQDFKKHVLDKISAFQADMQSLKENEKLMRNQENKPIDYERCFIRSLEDRILSLERQLAQKQAIIDKLLTTPKEEGRPFSANEIRNLMGGEKKAQTSGIEITESYNNSNIVEESIIPENNVTNKKKTRSSKKKRDRLKTTTNNAGNTVASNKQESTENTNGNSNDATVNTQEKNLENKSDSTVIIGDSMVKNLDGRRMRTKYGEKVFVKSFSGATTDDMSFHAVPSMKKQPDRVVLHTGANDFREEKEDAKIAQNIYALARTLKTEDNTVFVSGIISREDAFINERTANVNRILEELCKKNKFPFIDNSNINIRTHLNRSGLHLNHTGDGKLALNIISALRD